MPVPSSDRPSIAVLAFDNMSGDPAAEFLVDGIVEEITATLSRIRDFTVIARNSAYAYKGKSVDVREMSRALGVRYILEGSLRKAGDRVRITAQLIDAISGAHLWADRYDGVVDNLFDFEDQIAERVAGAVRPSIRTAEIALARGKRPEKPRRLRPDAAGAAASLGASARGQSGSHPPLERGSEARSALMPGHSPSPPGRGPSTSSITGRPILLPTGPRAAR